MHLNSCLYPECLFLFPPSVPPAGSAAALAYAQAHFAPFTPFHLQDVQRLMGCLVFYKRAALTPQSPPQPTQTPELASLSGQGDVTMSDAAAAAVSAHNGIASAVSNGQLGGAAPVGGASGGSLDLSGTPYAGLLSGSLWQQAMEEFLGLACSLMGMVSSCCCNAYCSHALRVF